MKGNKWSVKEFRNHVFVMTFCVVILFAGIKLGNNTEDWFWSDDTPEISSDIYNKVSLVLLSTDDTQLHIIARDAMMDNKMTEKELAFFTDRIVQIDIEDAKNLLQEVFDLPDSPQLDPFDDPKSYKEGGKTFTL